MIICDQTPQSYYEYVQPNRDQWGLIAQSPGNDRDGGDTAQRTGAFYTGMYFLFKENKVVIKKIQKEFEKELDKITVEPGRFVRHPDPSKWYSNYENFSRDQTTSIVIAMGLYGGVKEQLCLQKNFQNLLDNKGFYPNRLKNWDNQVKSLPYDYNDIAGPSDYSTYIRALKLNKWKWALYLGDVQTFGQALINVVASYVTPNETSNDINFTLTLLQAKDTWPTLWTRAAEYVYYNFRAFAPDTAEMGRASNPVQSAWNHYFDPRAHGPAMHKVFQCVIDKELSGKEPVRILETSNKIN